MRGYRASLRTRSTTGPPTRRVGTLRGGSGGRRGRRCCELDGAVVLVAVVGRVAVTLGTPAADSCYGDGQPADKHDTAWPETMGPPTPGIGSLQLRRRHLGWPQRNRCASERDVRD